MKRFLAILAGCILLFVVVCPITPTPIAVPGGKVQSVHVATVAVAAIVIVFPFNSERTLWNASSFDIPSGSANIVDLTCARLC